jgi:anti-anti-sigma regulatory factor
MKKNRIKKVLLPIFNDYIDLINIKKVLESDYDILDFKNIDYITSELIVEIAKYSKGKQLTLINVNNNIKSIFNIVGLDKIVKIR